ncbi:STAS/SEC14 domain-containing protein [Pontibacter arcticus]|uniref:STAS/SEC14 domain-containing protein n=1 Tax=Pontibacter arcticus TaxID=2080288 RepID=A0A364RGF9_9BACT|nr:STAS/SEC14 domain-containing protein [Pontibacter arcticus]RAU83345.1 STAS/SEC14 domain-containing protein [Pontibacter arcticus]
MKQELTNPFGRVYLVIHEDTQNRWIHVNWMGYLTEENIKTGARAYVAALQKTGYTCVLNDTRLIIGSWDHSLDWVLNDWAPTAASAGLRHFAMIATPESFANNTASAFYRNLKSFKAEVFDDMGIAKEWLKQYSLPESKV